jgi:acyl-CoA dehydrogenase
VIPNFDLAEEHELVRRTVRDFAVERVAPVAEELDREHRFPYELVAELGELGLMGMTIPEEYGGAGTDTLSYAIAVEELTRVDSSVAITVAAHHSLGTLPISMFGSDEQKREWLPPLIESPLLCSFALSEPDAGSDAARIKTTAERRGDEYVLNGSKMFITNAGHADWSVVFASTDRSKGHKGLSAFVVPMDADGVTIEKHLDKMGQRATDTSAFALNEVKIPAANLLGAEGDGFKIAMQTLDLTRPGTAAGAVGVAQAAYEYSVGYARERVTFDVPIAMHQGVNFLIADMATEIEAARLLTWQAAWMLDSGYGRKATLYSSFAKRFAADTAMKVATDAVQVFGGYGYIKEYPVEKLMRDAKLFQIYEGTSQIQRLVIAKEIFLPKND